MAQLPPIYFEPVGRMIKLQERVHGMSRLCHAVGEALRFYKLTPSDLVVLYDELDLAPGKLRIKTGGGSGGHNGIKSLDAHIGQNYRRVRIGIGHPGHKDRVSGYVLHDFGKDERAQLDVLLSAMADNLKRLLDGDESGFMSLSMQALNRDRGAQKNEKPAASPAKSPGESQPATIGKGPPTALGAALSRLLNRNAGKKTDKD